MIERVLMVVVAACLAFGQAAASQRTTASDAGGERLVISLSGVNLHAVVLYISEFTGKPVLLPDPFPGEKPVDIVSSSRAGVPAAQAMSILASALKSAGFAMLETESHIQVVPESQPGGVPIRQQPVGEGLAAETLMAAVIEVKNVEATRLVPVLDALKSRAGSVQAYGDANKLVIREYGPNLRAMQTLIQNLDTKWGGGVVEVCKLQNTSVESILSLVRSYVQNLTQAADPVAKKRLQGFSVYPHVPANSFLLFGHTEDIAKVRELIQSLDVKATPASRTFHSYAVLNRSATELVGILNGILAAARARGGAEAEPQPAVIADETNSAVIVVATPEKYAELLPLLKDLDRPKAQVLIEAALAELSMDKLLDLGVELATLDRPGENIRGFGGTTMGMSTLTEAGRVPAEPPHGGLTVGLFKNRVFDIAALVRLSAKTEEVQLIAAPRIMASDNRKATVEIAEEREFLKSVVTPEGRTSEVTSGGFHKAGITLEITPHVNEAGTIRLEIMTQTDEFLPGTASQGVTLTNRNSRKARTEVTIPRGCTVVIAGLTRTAKVKTVRKVPLLGDIPLLGFFFRRTETSDQQRNLCIFITPRVLDTEESLAMETQSRRNELKQGFGAPSAGPSAAALEKVTGGTETEAPATDSETMKNP